MTPSISVTLILLLSRINKAAESLGSSGYIQRHFVNTYNCEERWWEYRDGEPYHLWDHDGWAAGVYMGDYYPPTVSLQVKLQGDSRPYGGYDVPLTLKLYDPKTVITTGNILSLWNTQASSGNRLYRHCQKSYYCGTKDYHRRF